MTATSTRENFLTQAAYPIRPDTLSYNRYNHPLYGGQVAYLHDDPANALGQLSHSRGALIYPSNLGRTLGPGNGYKLQVIRGLIRSLEPLK
jgi:hypothetical protein